MAVNYCIPGGLATVRTTSLAMDDYDPSNLTSPSLVIRRKGFIAESFVRMPVDVVVDLPHPIQLSSVHVGLRLGSLKSESIQVLSTFCTRANTKSEGSRVIGSAWQVPGDQALFSTKPGPGEYRLSCPMANYLACCTSLTIRVLRCNRAAVLSSLQVWGTPVSWAPPIFSPISPPQPLVTLSPEPEEEEPPVPEVNEEEIPEDFLDAITFELMTMPILLPSGQNVNQTTLDRYTTEEAQWGRPPNDPFTSLPFKKTRKPIGNFHLKVRIDRFLATHERFSQDNSLPRTLGHATLYPTKTVTSGHLVKRHRKPSCTKVHSSENKSPEIQIPSPFEEMVTPTKRSFDDDDPQEAKKKQKFSQEASAEPFLSHEECLNKSLSDALSDLKKHSSFIQFSQPTPPPHLSQPKDACAECRSTGKDKHWFRMACSHLICRACLVKLSTTQLVCGVCKALSQPADIHKVHLLRTP